ncbi:MULTISPECIES: chaplin [unclassified Streptomyces]|uniref:chaplin n=1 Tax=unclassified Streptomyces TaxID=2593676 RepID=UPI0004AB4E5C|nr:MULTISPECIES: chaplin [unclassified Streptomyces]KJK52777.1 chaplin [Streptomyces sp. NRRL F-4428]
MKKRLLRGTTVAAAGVAALIGGAGLASAHGGATAEGLAAGSPGVASGNLGQVPVHVPVNVCALTVNLAGALNPAFGNTCVNA